MNLLSFLGKARGWTSAAILVVASCGVQAGTVTLLNVTSCNDTTGLRCSCTYDDQVAIGEEAIIEVFKVNAAGETTPIAAMSTRGKVGRLTQPMISGFIIEGNAKQKVVVRARGPSIGIANGVANPAIALYGTAGLIASNDNWKEQNSTDTTANDLAVAQLQASGFAPANDAESALLLDLDPGPYTAHIFGGSGNISFTCAGPAAGNTCTINASKTSIPATDTSRTVTITASCPSGINRWSASAGAPALSPGGTAASQTVTFAVPTTTTSYTYTVFGNGADLENSVTVNVAASGDPGTGSGTCGAGVLCYNTTATSGLHLITLETSQTAAVSIVMGPGRNRLPMALSKGRAGSVSPNGIAYRISDRPGDFSATEWPCAGYFTTALIGITVAANTVQQYGACLVDPTKPAYLNLRFIDPDGANTCPAGSCLVMVDWYWNQ